MIKTFPPQGEIAEWHWLQLRAAEDPRSHLYGCCDVFLSLHRSEGFGRGMAEALDLGLDVIATTYGGNTDFCNGPLAHPVRGWPRLGGVPDLDHAAELMQQVAARRLALVRDHEGGQQPIPAGIRRCWRGIGSGFRGRPLGCAIGTGWKSCGGSGGSWRGG